MCDGITLDWSGPIGPDRGGADPCVSAIHLAAQGFRLRRARPAGWIAVLGIREAGGAAPRAVGGGAARATAIARVRGDGEFEARSQLPAASRAAAGAALGAPRGGRLRNRSAPGLRGGLR